VKFALTVLFLFCASQALAAKNGVIQGSNVALRSAPDRSSDSVASLKSGDPVEVSNYPTKGFYKVRTSTGQVGWVESGSIEDEALPAPQTPEAQAPAASAAASEMPAAPSDAVPPAPSEALPAPPSEAVPSAPTSSNGLVSSPGVPSVPEPSPSPSVPITVGSPTAPKTQVDPDLIPYEDVPSSETRFTAEKEVKPKTPRQPCELKVFGGLQVLQTVLSFSQLGGNMFSSMPYFGAQFGIPLADRLLILLRVEHLSRDSLINGFDMSLSSTPVMTGLSYSLLDKHDSVRLQGAVLVGVAMATTLDATQTNLPPPNLSELSTQAFTEMLKLDLDIPISEKIEIYFEGGYRFLNSSSIGPSTQAPDNTIFQNQSGTTIPVPLNLSGFLIGAGISFLF
jgi:hypothetical protein